jgi:hypothetical protein
MLGLQRPELIQQLVVRLIADLGIVENVVAVRVVVELAPQRSCPLLRVLLRRRLGGGAQSSTSLAAGSISFVRS